jgi:hypothetical protein
MVMDSEHTRATSRPREPLGIFSREHIGATTMIVITEPILIAASVVAVGSRHPLGDGFVIFGSYLGGLSTGQPFLDGIFCVALP